MSAPTAQPPLLTVTGITKRFAGVTALDAVDLSVGRGEVHAVIGENGAGKSTLMKILAGVQRPDRGQILLDGQPQQFAGVADAQAAGIALIHQELNLADNLDVGANIFLGREPRRWGLVDFEAIHRQSETYLQQVGLEVSSRTRVDTLTIGLQQLVEIAKALSVNARLLIMDEPTSSLSQGESEKLFEVIRQLRDDGVTVIYISHRLGEVAHLADRVTVLRDGQIAGHLEKDQITHDAMVRLMVGRDISQYYARQPRTPGETVLRVRRMKTQQWPAHRLSFEVRAGEMVGVAGLVGAGRTEALETLFGARPALEMEVEVAGQPVHIKHCRDAIDAGLGLIPEDRKAHGLILEMGIRENIGLPGLHSHKRGGVFWNRSREKADSDRMVAEMQIKSANDQQPVRYLSGGNQQKVVIGKWLSTAPRILLLDEPTRGVDIGAKQEIYRLMEELAEQGVAILFVSSEMEEVLSMSDRVLVMHEGAITGELTRDQATEEAIMNLATGHPAVAAEKANA